MYRLKYWTRKVGYTEQNVTTRKEVARILIALYPSNKDRIISILKTLKRSSYCKFENGCSYFEVIGVTTRKEPEVDRKLTMAEALALADEEEGE